MNQMSDKFIEVEDISTFKPEELDGKTLKIQVMRGEHITITTGVDVMSGHVYVMSQICKEDK